MIRPVPIPAVLCIDVEPDDRHPSRPGPAQWHGFERMVEALDALRPTLAEASGRPVSFGWFLRMDPQIRECYGTATWLVERYGDVLQRLVGAGDELGLHVHAWRWRGDGWVGDHGDRRWIDECVATSFDAFESVLGPVRSYRGGERYFDPDVHRELLRRGVGVDLTMEPGAPDTDRLAVEDVVRGRLPPVAPELHRPFRLEVDGGSLLAVPLTASASCTSGTATAAGVPVGTLVPFLPGRLFRAALDLRRAAAPALTHLAFAVRSDTPLHPMEWRWFGENLVHVARTFGGEVVWSSPSAAADELADGAGPSEDWTTPGMVERMARALEEALVDAERTVLQVQAEGDAREAAVRLELDRVRSTTARDPAPGRRRLRIRRRA